MNNTDKPNTTNPDTASTIDETVDQPCDEINASEQPSEPSTKEAEQEASSNEPSSQFVDFMLPTGLTNAIGDLGFTHCTPIQGATLPYSLSDFDVTAQAQTGTGKTAAFLVTIFTQQYEFPLTTPNPPGTPRALIIAPTRELVLQIESDAVLLGKYMTSQTMSVVGGIDFQKQKDRLETGSIDILVATPGRLLDFARRRIIDLSKVEILVIDESDRMLDMGFIPDVRRIVMMTPHKRKRQTMFFSATFSEEVMKLASQWTIDPAHVVISPDSVVTDTVEQQFWAVSTNEKRNILLKILEQDLHTRIIIFVNRRDQTRSVNSFLSANNIHNEVLSGEVPQKKRISTLDKFKSGKIRVLVATDVAGRGIHVDDVSHVINFDLPEEAEDYVHRIGRTGRAGSQGTAISFISEDDAFNIPAIEDYLGHTINCQHPEFDDDPN